MKYLKLFEQFEEGHKFDILDLYLMDLGEVEKLFWEELDKRNPDLENIQVFLDSGLVGVHMKNDWDGTPLHVAARYNSLAVAKLLVSSGANLEAKDGWGLTPLHRVAMYNYLELAQFLISSGAEVNAKDNDGWTPLHRAARNNRLELAQLLISSGVDLEAKTNGGRTPLHWAKSEEMRDLLISHGGTE